MKIKVSLLLILALISANGNAETEKQQLHSNSCGPAALAQLLSGVSGKNISEQDILNLLRPLSGDVDDYNIEELENVSKKLGFEVATQAITSNLLPNLKEPVLVLINEAIKLNHFVVLTGIRPEKDINGTAYLFDSATGYNTKTPYKELVEESLTAEHSKFRVLRVKYIPEKLKKSSLYLPDTENEITGYYTEGQAMALAMATLSKKNQLIVDYTFNATLGNNKYNGVSRNLKNYNHVLSARYGVGNNSEIGGTAFSFINNYTIVQ